VDQDSLSGRLFQVGSDVPFNLAELFFGQRKLAKRSPIRQWRAVRSIQNPVQSDSPQALRDEVHLRFPLLQEHSRYLEIYALHPLIPGCDRVDKNADCGINARILISPSTSHMGYLNGNIRSRR